MDGKLDGWLDGWMGRTFNETKIGSLMKSVLGKIHLRKMEKLRGLLKTCISWGELCRTSDVEEDLC